MWPQFAGRIIRLCPPLETPRREAIATCRPLTIPVLVSHIWRHHASSQRRPPLQMILWSSALEPVCVAFSADEEFGSDFLRDNQFLYHRLLLLRRSRPPAATYLRSADPSSA